MIFLTGNDTPESETKGLRLGAMDFIKKPFVPDVLVLCVRHIIINLLGNAVKYTDSGSVTLSLNAEGSFSVGQDTYIIISVTDTGIGIKKQDIALSILPSMQPQGRNIFLSADRVFCDYINYSTQRSRFKDGATMMQEIQD